MTTYKIINEITAFFVVQTFEHGHTDMRHGPYKNEESAKRRIRDLKRKEAETVGAKIDNSSNVAVAVIADDFKLDYPTTGLLTINEHDHVVQNPDTLDDDMRKFVAENVRHHPNGNVSMPIKKAPFDWDGKLTADEKAMITIPNIHNFEIRETKPLPIARQVGVYPAIPKRAYQR